MKCARAVATLAAGVVMLAAPTVHAQQNTDPTGLEATPFGLRQGMSVEELGADAAHMGRGMYKLMSVPAPHPDVEFYVAQVSPRSGLCYIKGVGRQVRTNQYGTELRSQFEKVRDEVSAAYGRYRAVDMLFSDSMWGGPADWMAGLAERQRLLFAHWTVDTRANLRPHLTNVYVGATAKTSQSGSVVVEYYFDNEPGCQEEIDNGLQVSGFRLQQEP